MRIENAVVDEAEFEAAPASGVTWRGEAESLWGELIDEVERMTLRLCAGVPEHVRCDVESAAMVGLMEAVRQCDLADTPKFRENLSLRVQDAILAELAHFEPISTRGAIPRLVKEDGPASQNSAALAGEGDGWPADEHWTAVELGELVVPLLEEEVCGENLSPEEAFVGSYSAVALRWALSQLNKRERLVLRLAYKRGKPLASIAQRLHVSTPRAHQIRVEAERKLARLLKSPPTIRRMQATRK